MATSALDTSLVSDPRCTASPCPTDHGPNEPDGGIVPPRLATRPEVDQRADGLAETGPNDR
jgi:hypothetical protein